MTEQEINQLAEAVYATVKDRVAAERLAYYQHREELLKLGPHSQADLVSEGKS